MDHSVEHRVDAVVDIKIGLALAAVTEHAQARRICARLR
jgi:hypothetical protein